MDPSLQMPKRGANTSNPGNREHIFNMDDDPNESRARTTKGGARPRKDNSTGQDGGASDSKLPDIQKM